MSTPHHSPLQLFDLSNRTALVTGSSAGIGLTLAKGLLQAGARVVLNGRSADKLASVAKALRDEHSDIQDIENRVLVAAFDVTSCEQTQKAIAGLEQQVGAIDILINNAGITYRSPVEAFPIEKWHDIMRTNLDSVFFVSRAVVPGMIKRRQGKIINICSVQSELGRPGTAPYAASKGGLKMFTKGMAIDWGPHGIQVNGLGPGYFKTELTEPLVKDEKFSAWLVGHTPSRRWGDVADLIGAAVFLASPASDFVNGHILYVDGGLTATL
jgi:gluconate 5-dehydrogenase